MIVASLPGCLLYASDLLPTPAFEPNFVSHGTADVATLRRDARGLSLAGS
jgi:hypothetical protein